MTTFDGSSRQRESEPIFRFGIPVLGLTASALLVALGLWIAPDPGATGFQRDAEITRSCLSLAGSLVTVAIVSFLISEYWRRVDRRHDLEDRERARQESARMERRRLIGELRTVHHAVKTAQLRLNAHRSVLTYGAEMREVVMPSVAQLGGIVSDIKNHDELFITQDHEAILGKLGTIIEYLKGLTEEFEEKYLSASRLQGADHEWRQHWLKTLVKEERFRQVPPQLADLPGAIDNSVWRDHVVGTKADGTREFPQLAMLLELPSETGGGPDTHNKNFSTPLREVIGLIEKSSEAGHSVNSH